VTERVRVTGPPRRRTAARSSRARDIDTDTRLGEIYLGSLLREQVRLAARVLGALVLGVGSWPLLFHLWPGLGSAEVAGVPVAWLVLGVLVYPLLVGLGWWYVRRAERTERAFVDLMESTE
jgi:hypothetical protein